VSTKTPIKIWNTNYLELFLLKGSVGKIFLGKLPTHRFPLQKQLQTKYQERTESIIPRLSRSNYEHEGAATVPESIRPASIFIKGCKLYWICSSLLNVFGQNTVAVSQTTI
jgi:hypothetical protein